MNEIMGNAVDVPGNAHRVDKTENEHDPQRNARKQIEHAEKVSAVQKCGHNGECVPPCVRKDPGVGLAALGKYELAGFGHCEKTILIYYPARSSILDFGRIQGRDGSACSQPGRRATAPKSI